LETKPERGESGKADELLGKVTSLTLPTIHRFSPEILRLVQHIHLLYPTVVDMGAFPSESTGGQRRREPLNTWGRKDVLSDGRAKEGREGATAFHHFRTRT
jgi:hypothetical protein